MTGSDIGNLGAQNLGGFLAIVAMVAATYLTRVGGFWLMGRIPLTPRVRRMLDALPGSIVAAIVLPIVVRTGLPAVVGIAAVIGLMVVRRKRIPGNFRRTCRGGAGAGGWFLAGHRQNGDPAKQPLVSRITARIRDRNARTSADPRYRGEQWSMPLNCSAGCALNARHHRKSSGPCACRHEASTMAKIENRLTSSAPTRTSRSKGKGPR